jgi:hypothetical protein
MIKPINELSTEAKVWIFQANRFVSISEQNELTNEIDVFLNSWTAHNVDLLAASAIMHNLILVVAVDEAITGASGCSIDKLFRFVKQMELKYKVQFFDRMRVAYLQSNIVAEASVRDFEILITENVVDENTLVLNPLIQDLKSVRQSLFIPLKESWLNSYLPKHY